MRFRDDRGQAVSEVALMLPLLLVLVFGVVELATALNRAMTIAAATREGARVAGALVNGGGTLGCASGQSPNASTVDPLVVAAVERVLTGSGAQITLVDVSAIRIYKATASGAETSGSVNQWVYALNGGPLIAGQNLDFVEQSNLWPACGRNNASPADSAGITVRYTYRGGTPLRYFIPGLASFNMSDSAVMPLNASR
ncbi:MAG TPA: TadE/TadG family type IV pilus assembly protein [Methylomirabilota bacterium]|nr:TadE/TadG family type IV pilus assembly protein [Methylomirabilota bacterium]